MIFMSVALTLVQLSSAYLRYLPFSRELSDETISKLLKSFLLWSLAGLAINLYIFSDGLTYRAYKTVLFTVDWLPYFFIALRIIGKKLLQHIFIFGMQALWCFMLHSFSGMSVAFIYGQMSEELLPLQISFYLGYFVLLIKLEQKFFVNLLPVSGFFEEKSLRWTISLLPLAIFIGTIIPIVDVTFLPTWKERFSRIFLPIFFFTIYQSLSMSTQQVKEKQLQLQKNRLLQRQMQEMSEHNALITKNQSAVANLRKNLLENYHTIENFIIEEKYHEAMDFISHQTKILDSTRVEMFCVSPLINAALSMYIHRAEKLGIKVSHKVDLPAKLNMYENDFAVLISNLLENAIEASKKNPSKREISIIIKYRGGQYVVEIENSYDFPIKLGENGLPYTTKIGHGLGMTSLENFAKKYDAFVDFSHENGFVRFTIYYNGGGGLVRMN